MTDNLQKSNPVWGVESAFYNQVNNLVANTAVECQQKMIAFDYSSQQDKVSKFYTSLSKGSVIDLLIVIPYKSREEHLRAQVSNLKEQIEKLKDPSRVKIVLSEMDSSPTQLEFALQNDLSYVYYPDSHPISYDNGSPNILDLGFNKCFLMNRGVWSLMYRNKTCAKNVLFHDVDLIMGKKWVQDCLDTADFLNASSPYRWVCQTIKDRKVEYVSSELTEEYFSGRKSLDDLNSQDHVISPTYPEKFPPGGSIMVPADLFAAVGGYDEHLFFGYSPEDKFFLDKCLGVIGKKSPHVLGTHSRCFHMHHERSSHESLSLSHMCTIAELVGSRLSPYMKATNFSICHSQRKIYSRLYMTEEEILTELIDKMQFHPALPSMMRLHYNSDEEAHAYIEMASGIMPKNSAHFGLIMSVFNFDPNRRSAESYLNQSLERHAPPLTVEFK